MARKKTKKEVFNKDLFEKDFLIIALSLVGYLAAFLATKSVEVSCTEWCDWDLGPFVYTWLATTIIVFIIEIICYIGLIKKSPKKADKKKLTEYNIVCLFIIFVLCRAILKSSGLLLFIFGGINLGLLLGNTIYLKILNKR